MQNWEKEINKIQYLKSFDIEKSFNSELITEDEFNSFMEKGGYIVVDKNAIEKSTKDTSKLIKKEVWISRGGKQFKQTVWVSPDDNKEVETPIGGELSPSVKGLEIERYSDKSILIKGDTYANIDLMREIKAETGFGTWSGKAKGWIFGLTQLDKVLGLIWSDVKDKDQDKAQAIQNQKNSSLAEGDGVNVLGEKGKVEEVVSDSQGIKYNVTLDDGTKFQGVDEKVIEVVPETDDKKISEILGNSQPENRAKTEKQLFGIKPIENIHTYSLEDYMKLHGISDEEINKALKRLQPKEKKEGERKSSSSGSSKPKKEQEGLTKNQLIGKLIYQHYQSVKQAIASGQEVSESAIKYYPALIEEYNKQRQAMSEETKRKISEALTKNKPEEVVPKKTKEQEAKAAAEAFINSMSEEELNKLKDSFKSAFNELAEKEKSKLAELVLEHEKLKKEKMEFYAQAKASEDNYSQRMELSDKARELTPRIDKLEKLVRNQKNVITVLSNGGDLMEVTDAVGVKHENIPDFTRINTEDIDYTVDNILSKEKPAYIPEINEEDFKSGGYIFDIIKAGEDRYLLATNKYRENSIVQSGFTRTKDGSYDPEDGGFVSLTLDQVVLTQDYYTTKQKATFRKEAEEKNQRQVDNWNKFTDEKKKYYYDQRNFYESLPVAAKKKVTKEAWQNLSIEEKENIYIPVKKYNPDKLKSRFDERHMATSFHDMYERFVNPDAKKKDRSGNPLNRGVSAPGNTANSEVWSSWTGFRETLEWKINDINIQREEMSDIRGKAIETSYGEIGTNDILLDEFGVKVKRQNGEAIKPQEIEQLKKAWVDVQKTFGSLKENAKKDNLKLSHAGKTYMFASTAIGVYVPSKKTIGVTAKLGEDQLGFTLGHEVAHWMDHTIGRSNGKRHASDNYESSAGKIATIFRKNLNKKTDSKYLNATHECFARCLEMHHAIETQGVNALLAGKDRYIDSPAYVSQYTYENQIKPLIKQFFEENTDVLKSTLFDFFA